MYHYSTFKLSALALVFSVIICIGNLIWVYQIGTFETELYLDEHRQLKEDWESLPYVDIILVDDSENGCPLNYEPLIKRTWPGTYDTCETAEQGI